MTKSTIWTRRAGFTIIELMVVMGVVMILIALSLPAIGRVKMRAREVQSLSRIRQLGMMVLQYAGDNDDRVPAIYPPVFIEPGDPPSCWVDVEIGGRGFRGSWFSNSTQGYYALTPPPVPGVMRAPGAPDVNPIIVYGEATSHFTDYEIAECYYASPSYWNLASQRGPKQWGAQAISDTRYPSDKGLVFQTWVYDPRIPYPDSRGSAGVIWDIPSSVLWADLSATQELIATLEPGVPNLYRCQVPPSMRPVLPGETGPTIRNTKHGIAGRDRN